MTEGYAATSVGPLSLFHAQLIAQQIQAMPSLGGFDLESVRLLLELTEREFDEAVLMGLRHDLLPRSLVLREPCEQ